MCERKGPGLLSEFFAREAEAGSGKTKQWLADQCGVSRTTVHYWSIGLNRPADEQLRRLLEVLTGVPADAWFDEKDAERRAKWAERTREALAVRAE